MSMPKKPSLPVTPPVAAQAEPRAQAPVGEDATTMAIGAVSSDESVTTPLMAIDPRSTLVADLQVVLSKHQAWVKNDRTGQRANLEGADLSNMNLRGVNLKNAILTGAKLAGSDLSGANLEGADLHGSDLSGAQLMRANLSYSNLERAMLDGANLELATLDGAVLNGVNLSGIGMRGASLVGAQIEGACLKNADLGFANLIKANLDFAELDKATLCAAKLHNASLKGASLRGADLRLAELNAARLGGADMEEVDLENAHLKFANLENANLRNARLTGADLTRANFEGANLKGANLAEAAVLEDVRLKNATLPDGYGGGVTRRVWGSVVEGVGDALEKVFGNGSIEVVDAGADAIARHEDERRRAGRPMKLPVFDMELTVSDKGGTIISSLVDRGEPIDSPYNTGVHTIESMVLAHAAAGVDVESPAYLEGIETTVEALGNFAPDAGDEVRALTEKLKVLESATVHLVRSFVTGSHYGTQNPYSRSTVKAALKALAVARDENPDRWMDMVGNDTKRVKDRQPGDLHPDNLSVIDQAMEGNREIYIFKSSPDTWATYTEAKRAEGGGLTPEGFLTLEDGFANPLEAKAWAESMGLRFAAFVKNMPEPMAKIALAREEQHRGFKPAPHGLDEFWELDPRAYPFERAERERGELEAKWDAHFAGTALAGEWTYRDVAKVNNEESWYMQELDQILANYRNDPQWLSRITPEAWDKWAKK